MLESDAGLAGTHDSWGPQVKGLTGTDVPNDVEPLTVDESLNGPDDDEDEEKDGVEVCCFDNRGMGRSSVPMKKSEYTYVSRIPCNYGFFVMSRI